MAHALLKSILQMTPLEKALITHFRLRLIHGKRWSPGQENLRWLLAMESNVLRITSRKLSCYNDVRCALYRIFLQVIFSRRKIWRRSGLRRTAPSLHIYWMMSLENRLLLISLRESIFSPGILSAQKENIVMLEGRTTALRALELSDLHQLQDWRNNAEMRRNFREYRELNMYDQDQWFTNICCGNKKYCMFGIVSKHEIHIDNNKIGGNKLIGVCGLTNIDWLIRSAELSFYIGAYDIYADNILAKDSVEIMINHAFNSLNLNKVWAELYDFDFKKIQILELLKMKRDGELRANAFDNGCYHNSYIYSLLRSEWPSAGSDRKSQPQR